MLLYQQDHASLSITVSRGVVLKMDKTGNLFLLDGNATIKLKVNKPLLTCPM